MMDLLSAIAPKAVLFLGKCGGLKPPVPAAPVSCTWRWKNQKPRAASPLLARRSAPK